MLSVRPLRIRSLKTYVRRRLLVRYALFLGVFLLVYSLLFFFSLGTLARLVQSEIYKQFDRKLSKAEDDLVRAFQEIIAISHNLILDENLGELLTGEEDFFLTDGDVQKEVNSLLGYNEWGGFLKVTVFDARQRLFANWSRNFRSYDFLSRTDIAEQAKEGRGVTAFSDFEDSFDRDDRPHKVINIHRKILSVPEGTGTSDPLLILTVHDGLLSQVFQDTLENERGGFFLLNQESRLQVHFSRNFMTGQDFTDLLGHHPLQHNGRVRWDSIVYLYSRRSLDDLPGDLGLMGWQLYLFLEYDEIADYMRTLSAIVILANVLSLLLLILFSFLINRDIIKPITDLDAVMAGWSLEKPPVLPVVPKEDEIGDIYRTFDRMDSSVRTLFANLEEEHRVREFYQVQALRSQLNPHFLFNTLNAVKMLALIDRNAPIVSMIESLGELLDYSMHNRTDWVPLKEELKIIESYIRIQNIRFGSDVRLVPDIPRGMEELPVLKFILQPVIENTFTHGFDERTIQTGRIFLCAEAAEDGLRIVIRDNGRGISDSALMTLGQELAGGLGPQGDEGDSIGLSLVASMIRAACGESHGIMAENSPEGGAVIQFMLPLIKKNPGNRP